MLDFNPSPAKRGEGGAHLVRRVGALLIDPLRRPRIKSEDGTSPVEGEETRSKLIAH